MATVTKKIEERAEKRENRLLIKNERKPLKIEKELNNRYDFSKIAKEFELCLRKIFYFLTEISLMFYDSILNEIITVLNKG